MDIQIHTEDLPDCPEDNLGGIYRRIWYAPTDYFSMMATNDFPHKSYEKMRSVAQEKIKLKGNKTLKYIDCYLDNNSVAEKILGSIRKQKMISELRISVRKMTAQHLGFVQEIRNAALVFFIPDNNGNVWVVGDKKNAAYLASYDATTGSKFEDDNLINLVFTANTELYIYNGDPEGIVSQGAFTVGFSSGFKI